MKDVIESGLIKVAGMRREIKIRQKLEPVSKTLLRKKIVSRRDRQLTMNQSNESLRALYAKQSIHGQIASSSREETAGLLAKTGLLCGFAPLRDIFEMAYGQTSLVQVLIRCIRAITYLYISCILQKNTSPIQHLQESPSGIYC
jgi:hypothetical protein